VIGVAPDEFIVLGGRALSRAADDLRPYTCSSVEFHGRWPLSPWSTSANHIVLAAYAASRIKSGWPMPIMVRKSRP